MMSTEGTIMKRIAASLAAATLLVAGAFVAVAVSNTAADAQVADDEMTTDVERPEPGAVMTEVLDGLVADGTLTQAQADAVADAFKEKREELKDTVGEMRQRHRRGHMLHRIGHLLDDGVISADEIAELPDNHPFKDPDGPFAEALEDGQITQAEWDAIVAERKAAHESSTSGAGTSGTTAITGTETSA
jgi:polyhydroxyalkanoate synthesis regulator phasin